MAGFDETTNWIFDNLPKLFFPEELISLDREMSKTELMTLFLVDRQGEIIMSRLAGDIGIPMSTATGIVDRLVKHGYLLRERNEVDRRIVTLRLTDDGKAVLQTVKETVSGYIDVLRKMLTEDEQEFLMKTVLKVFAALKKPRKAYEYRETIEEPKRIVIE